MSGAAPQQVLTAPHVPPRVRLAVPSPFAIGAMVTAAIAVLEAADVAGLWLLWEDIHLVLAPALAAAVVWQATRRGEREYGSIRRALTLAMACTALGQLLRDVPDVVPSAATFASGASDVSYVAGALVGMSALMRGLHGRLPRDERRVLMLDGLIIMITAMALVVAAWQIGRDLAGTGQVWRIGSDHAGLAIMLFAASFFASAASAALASLALRVRPTLDGVWAVILGIVLIAVAWCGWLARFVAGVPDTIEPMDFVFTGGALLLGYGGLTIDLRPDSRPGYERVAVVATEWLPMAAVVGVGAVAIGVRPGGWFEPVSLLAWMVVATAMIRQRLTRQRERAASDRLTREIQERAATSASLSRIEAAATPEATADLICTEALRLDGIDTAIVYAFETQTIVPLAVRGLADFPVPIGAAVPVEHAGRLRRAADLGLSIERWDGGNAAEPFVRSMIAAGATVEVVLPLRWNDEPVGAVAMGTTSDRADERVTQRLAALTEFAVVAGAVLGPMIASRRRLNDLRREIRSIIETEAFHPVFQPFVLLETGETVGFEALTRFDDGRRPDLRFGDARDAGLSVELEVACLHRQLAAAALLPARAFVSLNASPELVERPDLLLQLMSTVDREVVIEITEHVEIADYAALLPSIERIRARGRLAVDDAGAGYAGLRHIVELRPQFVKLDISVVRSVDSDRPRQAMVAGMAFFAAGADCELIAEGIETPAELETLRKFGVRYGQGYLLGRPAPAEVAAAAASGTAKAG